MKRAFCNISWVIPVLNSFHFRLVDGINQFLFFFIFFLKEQEAALKNEGLFQLFENLRFYST